MVIDNRRCGIFIERRSSGFAELCNSEIKHLNAIAAETIRLEPDVVGLEIAMNDSLLVSFVNCGTNLIENVSNPFERQLLFFSQHVTKRAAVEILHHEVSHLTGLHSCETKVSHVDNVRVSQATGRACFALEPFDKLVVTHELR